jgi:predicted ATP-grasp superfamily ATP-dependent carboligase
VTDWNPEVAALGLRFFQGIGLRGLACVEFKRDPRDEVLKLIECNHRFTEPNELLTRAGLDLATLVYNRLTKRPLPKLDSYREGICLVKPWEDILAFRQLRKSGELSWSEWLLSRAAPTSFLYFKWWDPMPWVFQMYLYAVRQIGKVKAWRARWSPASVIGNLAKATG